MDFYLCKSIIFERFCHLVCFDFKSLLNFLIRGFSVMEENVNLPSNKHVGIFLHTIIQNVYKFVFVDKIFDGS